MMNGKRRNSFSTCHPEEPIEPMINAITVTESLSDQDNENL